MIFGHNIIVILNSFSCSCNSSIICWVASLPTLFPLHDPIPQPGFSTGYEPGLLNWLNKPVHHLGCLYRAASSIQGVLQPHKTGIRFLSIQQWDWSLGCWSIKPWSPVWQTFQYSRMMFEWLGSNNLIWWRRV